MAVLTREAVTLALWRQLLSVHRQEVEVRREGAKEVQNIVAAIISDDTFTLDRRAQLHGLVFLVQHVVPLDLRLTAIIWENEQTKGPERTINITIPLINNKVEMRPRITDLKWPAGLLQQLQVFGVRHNSLSEVNGAVDDALLLLTLQDTWDDGLGCDTVAPVVHHYCPKCVQTLHIHRTVSPYSVQVISGRGMGSGISAQLTIVIPHIEAQAKEDVVPDEHLHARLLAGIDGHNVSIDDCHGASSGSCGKVTVDLQIIKKGQRIFVII